MFQKWMRWTIAAQIAAVAAVSVMTGSALAYLTDEEQAKNIILIGKVKGSIYEDGWENEQVLAPRQKIEKSPVVVNEGTNAAFAFLEVTVPYEAVTPLDEDYGTKLNGDGEKEIQPLIMTWYTNEDGEEIEGFRANDEDDGNEAMHWMLLDVRDSEESEDGSYTETYIFGYDIPLEAPNEKKTNTARTTTQPIFDKIQMCNYMEGDFAEEEDFDEENNTWAAPDKEIEIGICAYLIQTDFVVDEAGSDIARTWLQTHDTLDKETLRQIYEICFNQNQSSNTDN